MPKEKSEKELKLFFEKIGFSVKETINYSGVRKNANEIRLICAYKVTRKGKELWLNNEEKTEIIIKKLGLNYKRVNDGLPLRVQVMNLSEIEEILKEEITEKNDLEIENVILNKIKEIEDEKIREVARDTIIKARIGQTEFRSNLLERHKKCQICGLVHSELLVASHIKPWSKSDNKEKLDEFNGLLLCSQHDAIFDKGYISFEENGIIKISKKLSDDDCRLLNIDNSVKILVDEKMRWYYVNKKYKLNLNFISNFFSIFDSSPLLIS